MKRLTYTRIILLTAYVLSLVPALAQDSTNVSIPAYQLRRAIAHIRLCDIMQQELMQVKINYALLEKTLSNRDSAVFLLKRRDSVRISYIAAQEKEAATITLQKEETVNYAAELQCTYKVALRQEKRKKWLWGTGGIALGFIIKIIFLK